MHTDCEKVTTKRAKTHKTIITRISKMRWQKLPSLQSSSICISFQEIDFVSALKKIYETQHELN